MEALKSRWEASGTSLRAGVTDRQLRAFERRYGATLPDDLAEYLRSVDGMNDGETDERLVRFWTLDELRPLREVTPVPPAYEGYFCFADYPLGTRDDPLGARCYAIRLLPGAAKVVLVGAGAPRCVADSFSHFLDAYLGGSRTTRFGDREWSFATTGTASPRRSLNITPIRSN